MNCDQARIEIIAYLKNELSDEHKEHIAEHLARCPACRHELEGARRLLTWTEAASEQTVIKKVEDTIDRAIRSKASDIHFESQHDNSLRVRYRIDGVLHDAVTIDAMERNGVITRIKMMADVDASVTSVPQDGRMTWKLDEQDYDLRVSFCPFARGEGIVMRIHDSSIPLPRLDTICLYPDHLKSIKNLIHQPHGLFITSGPTGSGKTTSLHSILIELNNPSVKIMTIEDPVEFIIDGVNHTQVCKKEGFSYSVALRSFLRQDPDIIMAGGIRDIEVASIVSDAVITGHLVLSSLHTVNAIAVVQYLRDIGMEDYTISAVLIGALNQRLVRCICPACKERVTEATPALRVLRITDDDLAATELFKGKGCEACHGTGYKGRGAIYELLTIDANLREMIGRGASCEELLQAAIANDYMPMADDARRKVLDGMTTAEEVIRVLSLTE